MLEERTSSNVHSRPFRPFPLLTVAVRWGVYLTVVVGHQMGEINEATSYLLK